MSRQEKAEHVPWVAQGHATPETAAPFDLLTVRQFCEKLPAWTPPGVRNMILNAEPRVNSKGQRIGGNGLSEAGVIWRIGRRVLLSPSRFLVWIAAQQRQREKRAA